MTMILTGWGYA
jgi:aconitase A